MRLHHRSTAILGMKARPITPITNILARFVGVLAVLVSLSADVQAQPRVARIGVIAVGLPSESAPSLDAFRRRMIELGYVEGRNIAIDVRFAAAEAEAYRNAAAELVARKVDVLLTANTAATRAAKLQTTTIPIVMVHVGDPDTSGLVNSLSRPGGNVTGQSFLGPELSLKGFDLITEAVPRAKRVALLYDPELVNRDPPDFRPVRDAAQKKGVTLVPVRLPRSGDLDAAFAAAGQPLPSALVVVAVGPSEQLRIAEFATQHRIPAIFSQREAINAHALMSYGPNFVEFWRGAATYVDKILKGAKPADLPVERASAFQLTINLKTAKALGITLPASVMTRADQLIE